MSLRRTPFPAFSRCPFACLFPSVSPLSLSHSMYLCLCLFGVLFGPGPHDELTMSCVLRVHPCVGPLSLTWHTHTPPSPCPPSAAAAATALFCQTFPFVCRLSNVRCILLGALLQSVFFTVAFTRQSQQNRNRNRNSKVENPNPKLCNVCNAYRLA